jgi:hypothetical protein
MIEKNTNHNLIATIVNEDLKKKLHIEKNVYVTARTSKLQRKTAEKIIERTKENLQLNSREEALAVIAILLQQGGTARSCDGNMTITLFDKEIKLADLRKTLKQMSCNKAERKLARTLANEIYEIALIMELPGNLYLKIQKENLERKFTVEEKIWLSDFQSENENCPVELRTLITETFKKIKERQRKK